MNVVQEIIKRSLKKADIYMCVCTREDIKIKVFDDCIALSRSKHNFHWEKMEGDSAIHRARSRAATNFLKSDCDILFFLDDDVTFKKEDAEKLADNVLDGKLICGGMYVQKGTLDKTLVLEEGEKITFAKDAKPQKAVCISTGFMMIHRSVFEALLTVKDSAGDNKYELVGKGTPWAYHPFFTPEVFKLEDGKRIGDSEDWTFCLNARKLGFQSWVDPSIFLGHIGRYTYTLADRLKPSIQMDDNFRITI